MGVLFHCSSLYDAIIQVSSINDPNPANDTLIGRHGLRNTRRVLLGILQWALSTAIVLIHSKNVIGVIVRMALGISF